MIESKTEVLKFDENYLEFVKSKLNKGLTPDKIFSQVRLLQGAIGLCTEFAELEEASNNVGLKADAALKEVGDVFFYLSLCFDYFNIPLTSTDKGREDKSMGDIHLETLELVKKYVFQQRGDLRGVIIQNLLTIRHTFLGFFDEATIIGLNVSKLSKRYSSKEGFTVDQSINRKES